MAAHRYLYEKLAFHYGYLVIPFKCGMISGSDLYSYQLLCAFERQGHFHKAVNSTEEVAVSVERSIAIAQSFLAQHSDLPSAADYVQQRYVYQGNLILISEIAGKYFYDHYPPDRLTNLAAPRLFETEADCIAWVKQGIDRIHPIVATHDS
ncbi:MAG: hypothetical protein HC852_14620 [Acaryochloridaceae cyanobacterium RU_4_10]|nr:hypothetical protein [Acaryochloridaceae cyanobacterium RU_4_10]